MLLKVVPVVRKRGAVVDRDISINIARAFNCIPVGTQTQSFYEEDRRKPGTPLKWVFDEDYPTFIADMLAYVPGVAVTIPITSFDGEAVSRTQLLAIDNISYIEADGANASVIYYEWEGKFELIKIGVALSLEDVTDLINTGSYS